jgi:hypothetical protein
MKLVDATFSDLDYETIWGGDGGLPYHPDQDPDNISGNVWGIISVTQVFDLLDGDPENQNLAGAPYYNAGDDGKYYFGVYGGLTYIDDSGSLPGNMWLGATADGSYLKIYEVDAADVSAYDDAWAAGPNVSGGGAFGTFGLDIINAPSADLFFDCVFSEGTLAYYDPNFLPGDLEFLTLSDSVTGSAQAYLDVIGGSGENLILKNSFPYYLPFAPNRADLKIISDLNANWNPISEWTSDWTASSEDPVTGIGVPEPATMLLLGTGLFGLAGYARRKSQRRQKRIS